MMIEDYMKEKEYIIIPPNWCATKFYTIIFEGWNKYSFDANDVTLNRIMNLAAQTLDSFIAGYKENHVFSNPVFFIKADDGIFGVKIGTLEKEEYQRRVKNNT